MSEATGIIGLSEVIGRTSSPDWSGPPMRLRVVSDAVPSTASGWLRLHDLIEGASATLAPFTCSATDPAVIAYTSGTTGRPMCLLVSHGNLQAALRYAHPGGPDVRPKELTALLVLPFI